MKVLLTGSTGYIGRRLKQKLLNDENIELKLLVRNKKSVSSLNENTQIIEGDTFNKESLKEALKDVEVAYYLIHSLSNENYKDLDKTSVLFGSDVKKQFFQKRIKGRGYCDVGTSVISEFYTPLVPKGHDFLQTIGSLAQARQDGTATCEAKGDGTD